MQKTIANHTISNQTRFYYNGHNLVIFEARRLKFCMVVHIDNTYLLNQTISNQTKYYYNGFNLVIFEAIRLKFRMVVHIENTHILYHAKPNQIKPNQTIQKPNQISL